MTPTKHGDRWFVRRDDFYFGPFDTNAKAWRWIDRYMGEYVNRTEAAHGWSAEQQLKSSV
jgi:hypothetical protein